MTRLTFTELANQLADTVDDATLQIADIARNFYCGIYNETPAWVLRGNRLVSPVARRTLESLCAPNLPPVPPPPTEGLGQCGVLYQVRGEGVYQAGAVPGYTCGESMEIIGYTQFTGYYIETIANAYENHVFAGAVIRYRDLDGNIQEAPTTFFGINDVNSISTGTLVWNDDCSFVNNRVGTSTLGGFYPVRLDGEPDDCGTPGGYPEQPPPQPSDISTDVDVVTIAGDTITYNVSINTDVDGYPSFPPVINVSGIMVDIDATGVGIGEVNIGTKSGGRDGGGSGLGGDQTDGTPDGTEDEILIEEPPEEVEEGEEKTVENLVALKIDITSVPVNAKKVSGNGGQELIYAGWVSFLKDGYAYPRDWIDFSKNYYAAPEDNTGYSVTIKRGYRATVTEVKKEVPVTE